VELQTPKDDPRAAVFDVFSLESQRSQTLSGNIRKFKIGFRKKTTSLRACFSETAVKVNKDGDLVIYPLCYQGVESVCSGKRTKRKASEDLYRHDVRVYKHGGKFWLLVPFGCRDPREGSLAEDKKGIAG
jgi:hypothetical protein